MLRHLLAGPAFVALVTATPALAQDPPRVEVPAIAADPADVGTIDGVITAFYDVISGPAGQPRQWARDRTLYVPDVRFVSMSVRDGKPHATIMSHQQFVDRTNAGMVANGFYENEIHRVTRTFGNTTHVFSTYEMRDGSGRLFGRGVNSIQLFWDGERWWISGVAWDDERPDNPIPAGLLPARAE
jgi:hypothetical protein